MFTICGENGHGTPFLQRTKHYTQHFIVLVENPNLFPVKRLSFKSCTPKHWIPSKVVTTYNECGQVSAMDQQKLRKSELARNESSITRIHQQRIRSNGTGNEFWTSLQSTQQYNGLKNIKTHLEMHMFSKQNSKSSWTTERSGVDLKTHKNRMQQQQKRA